MGFRFRKSIKICKGVRLNVSKSGIGMSAGVKGFRVSSGPRGTYATSSIPGTGISYSQRVGGSSGKYTQSKSSPTVDVKVRIEMDDNTGDIQIIDQNGSPVPDNIARQIKRTTEYKNLVKQGRENLIKKINESTNSVVEIYKFTPEIIDSAFLENQLNQLAFIEYDKKEFSINEPTLDSCREQLVKESNTFKRSLLCLFSPKRKASFVEKELPVKYNIELKKWTDEKSSFERKEEERRLEIEKINKEAQLQITELTNRLHGEKDFVIDTITKLMGEITLPVDFSVDVEYDYQGKRLYIDLDLPEIETMPTKKASELKSGKVSVKEKTQKELKYDYAICVTGMAFYLSGICFNISPTIEKIVVSGYTQRVSAKTGLIKDDYVYSVIFTRDVFNKINFSNINPIDAFSNFEHKINLTSTYIMKEIEPYDMSIN